MRRTTKEALKTVTVQDVDNLVLQQKSLILQTSSNPVAWHRALELVMATTDDPITRECCRFILRLMDRILAEWPQQEPEGGGEYWATWTEETDGTRQG